MDRLVVEPEFAELFHENGIDSCAALAAWGAEHAGEIRSERWSKGRRVLLRTGELRRTGAPDTTRVYYKAYEYTAPAWRFALRPSKARNEYRNYARLADAGLPTLRSVAWGEQRGFLGSLRRACIVTVALPDSVQLDTFLSTHSPRANDAGTRRLRAAIIRRLALQTKQAHAAGFFHNDLFLRNFLIAQNNSETPEVWWIDSPRGVLDRSFFNRRRTIKDLASLDKAARKHCTRTERLTFLLHYLGRERRDPSVSNFAAAVLRYSNRRWGTPHR